ncbi:hypothetical protein MKW94_016995 [Papaver nudicaule]|uniref:Malectin-like domain-containing protein n=1 Tax=Papaver nudicaule TaxID=74823 RepID=A0AA41SEF8_PAPNU|nr:hypothetical protein [Papaver nudicaule]
MIDAPNLKAWDPRVMSTLRAFPTRKKNCYSIDIDTTMEETERILVRASFYYGNYDEKSAPPTFNLQFNGNKWSQIVTHQDDIIYTEMVYSLIKGNNLNICLAQIQHDNIPFISALEVRSLDNPFAYSYINPNYPLFFFERFAFGTTTTIRYPEDDADRIWSPFETDIRVRSNVLYRSLNIEDKLEALRAALERLVKAQGNNMSTPPPPPAYRLNYNDPPKAILKTHLESSSDEDLVYTGISDPELPINYNAYFSEATKLNSTQKRSFDILVNNKLDADGIDIRPGGNVIPPFGYAEEVLIFNVTSFATNSSYSINFVPTNDSTLPPIINALEGYTIGDKLVQGTNSSDGNSYKSLS